MLPVIVGTLTLTESREVAQHYETAAWETRIRVEPGTYPVVAYGPDVDHVYVRFTGRIVACYMPALWAGNRIPGSKHDGSERVGQEMAVGERQSPTVRAQGADIMAATLRTDIAWNGAATQNAALPWRILVTPPKAADLRFPVETVSMHEVNKGSASAFWQVTATARTVNPATQDGAGWYSVNGQQVYRASQPFRLACCYDRKMTQAEAAAVVAKVKAAGAICPAHWQGSAY